MVLKKICIFLILCVISMPAYAEDEKKEEATVEVQGEAISILGDVIPRAGEKGYMVFAGQVKNNTKELFHSVEIVFEVLDTGGNLLDSTTAPISGENEGILEGEETGFFEARTTVHISTAGSYKYKINWQAFKTGEEGKPETK